jgi:dTDP-glucose pyrophosphorylase
MEDIVKIKTSPETSIKDALKQIDSAGMGILFVCTDDGRLWGSLTDGDIRRRILKTGNLQDKVVNCANRHPVFVVKDCYTVDEVKYLMLKKTIEVIPVVDNQKRLVDVLFWKDLFEEDTFGYKKIDIPVVIMAGGKGERLEPFTKILPKPLIPIGEKSIIEIVIDEFRKYGIKRYYLILNYKGEMIESYFDNIERDYEVNYVREEEFLGTAGGLKLLEGKIRETFILSNCDVIVKADFEDVVKLHKEKDALLSVLSSIQHYKIPYGIVEFSEGGIVKDITEKPEYTFCVNAGVYVMNRETLQFIPKGSHFDMTDLIKSLLQADKKIITYPVSENDYIDIGQWEEYRKVVDRFYA